MCSRESIVLLFAGKWSLWVLDAIVLAVKLFYLVVIVFQELKVTFPMLESKNKEM